MNGRSFLRLQWQSACFGCRLMHMCLHLNSTAVTENYIPSRRSARDMTAVTWEDESNRESERAKSTAGESDGWVCERKDKITLIHTHSCLHPWRELEQNAADTNLLIIKTDCFFNNQICISRKMYKCSQGNKRLVLKFQILVLSWLQDHKSTSSLPFWWVKQL